MAIYRQVTNEKASIAVLGLGYVGLPLTLAFSKITSVIGFDTDMRRIAGLKNGLDWNNDTVLDQSSLDAITLTHSVPDLKKAICYIVAVPTPLDEHHVPDLSYLEKVCEIIGKVLDKGNYVIFESTVYPGCTEEFCIPIIERKSGLVAGEGFKYGYSPERMNPGDKVNQLSTIVKVVSGCDDEAVTEIANLYASITTAGVYITSSIKVAEASKVIENTQRDLNIALMNEASMMFDLLGVNTHEVLEAAATKWNFQRFSPGLVGGYCVGAAPYYLNYKLREKGYEARLMLSGRAINDEMPFYISRKIIQQLIKNVKELTEARVLVLGAAFKENVSDVRNTKVIDLIRELQAYSVSVDVVDPLVSPEIFKALYNIELKQSPAAGYDAIIVAVPHKDFDYLTEEFIISISHSNVIFADLKGYFRKKIKHLKYWSL